MEIMIAIAILGTLAIITISAFSPFRKGTDLDTATEKTLGLLLEARARTLSSENATQYGIHFESSRIVLFTGSTYISSDPLNEETLLPSTVTVSGISLAGGGDDIVFSRLTGEITAYGTITLSLTSDATQTRQISILSTGLSSIL